MAATNEAGRRAAVYARVSTAKQEDEGTSLDTQEAACRAYCGERGYAVVEPHVYREVWSGAELWDRPKLSEVRAAGRERAVDVIVAYCIDRLSRDPVHLGVIVSEAEHKGVAVEFVTEPLDDSPEGGLIRFVRGYAAKLEREKIKERALRGKHARVASGKLHSYGHELYGYVRDNERGVRLIHEGEAAIIRRIFRRVAEGGSIRGIVRALNAEGVLTPSAGKVVFRDGRVARWGTGCVHRILREEAYKGTSIAWRYQRSGNKGSYVRRAAAECVILPEGTTPAIVEPALWEAVAARLAGNAAASATRNTTRPYLLRGLIACAVCGKPMRSSPEHGRRVYRCSSRETPAGACGGKRVPAEAVEAWVWAEVEAVLADPAIIAAEVERLRESGFDAGLAADRDAAARQLAKLDRKQEALVAKLAHVLGDDFPTDLLEREIARTEQERKATRSALVEAEERLGAQASVVVRLDDLHAYCGRVRANLSTVDFAHRRDAVEALVERVVASGTNRGDWRLDGSIPVGGGVTSQSSKHCGHRRRRPPDRA